MENDAAGFAQREAGPRFSALKNRHHDGTAPRAVAVYQLFQTPKDLAAIMAAILAPGIDARILEPSAGLGRLLDAIAWHKPREVVAVEMAPECAAELYRQDRPNTIIKQRDFLELTPAEIGIFDAVIMNPPFHMRSDIRHIQHARQFVRQGGKIVALCMDTPRRREELKPTAWQEVPAGSFKETGTNTATVIYYEQLPIGTNSN